MNARRLLALTSSGATICALVFWRFGLSPSADVGGSARGKGQGTAVPSEVDEVEKQARLRSLWRLGEQHRYQFLQDSKARADGMEIARIRLKGEIYIGRVSATLVRYRFEGLVDGNGGAPGARSPGTPDAQELQRPFFVEEGSVGQAQLRVDPAVGTAATQIWMALAAALRLEWPPGPTDSWVREEVGPLGTCSMRYEASGKNRVDKTRLECASPVGMRVVPFLRQSSVQKFDIRADRFETVTSTESIETARADGIPQFTSETTLSLRYAGSEQRKRDISSWSAEAASLRSVLAGLTQGKAGGNLARGDLLARIGGRTFVGVMSQMSAFESLAQKRQLTSDENAAFGRSFIALRSMLQLDSQHLAAIEAHVRADGPLTQHLLGVLGEAGTPDAQRLLADYLESADMTARNRTLAGIALGRVSNPTPDAVEALDRMQDDPAVSEQSTYSLGSNVNRLATANPALGQRVLDGLLEDIAQAPVADTARYLKALGNAGAVEALPTLREYASSRVDKHRRDAAVGLRRIPGAEAEELLLELLVDVDAGVRAQAATSIVSRTPTPALIDGIGRLIVSEPEYAPRARGVEGAARWLRVAAAIAPALRIVAERDPEEHLRRMAAQALRQHLG